MKIKKIKIFLPRFYLILKREGLLKAVLMTWRFLEQHIYKPYGYIKWKNVASKNKSRFIIKKIHGSKMFLDLKDKGISKQLILKGTREELQTELVKKILKPGMKVLDIGANIGYYALLESKLVGKKGEIYALEPSEKNFKLLKKNKILNNSKNIKLIKKAISDKAGYSKLYTSSKSNLNVLFRANSFEKNIFKLNGKSEIVPTITLDRLIEKLGPIDFIRFDLEGFESKIFFGLDKVLSKKKVRIFFFEVHPFLYKNSTKEMGKYLSRAIKAGYKIKVIVDRYGLIKPNGFQDALNIIAKCTWAPTILLEINNKNG